MKKEEIIEVLKKHAKFISDGDYYYANEGEIEAIADELQTKELSDEEIHRQATEYADKRGGQYWYDALYTAYTHSAKWYREQIKQL